MVNRQIGAKVPPNTAKRFEAFCEEEGFDNRSEAVRELVSAGLDVHAEPEQLVADGGQTASALSTLSERGASVALTAALVAFVFSLGPNAGLFFDKAIGLTVVSIVLSLVWISEQGISEFTERWHK